MGIYINLLISKSVTKKEWEDVYKETLELIKHLPFAEERTVTIHGIDTICLVPTKEREEKYGTYNKVRVGWDTVGDYEYMRTAEDYYLPKDLVQDTDVEADVTDAIMGAVPAYMSYDWKEERFNHVYDKWGRKTQGEPYHIYLLAVSALIEARLGVKAFTYGDITRGQFKKAVQLANKYLDNKIELPDRCYMDKLFKRVTKLALTNVEQLEVFEQFYLGTKDIEFGNYMRKSFSKDVIDKYWKRKFKGREIGTTKFDDFFNEYMLWGFELDRLCDYVEFKDSRDNEKYEEFVIRVMDAKLHLKDKNCEDLLKIDQESEKPYSVYTLLAQFVFAGAKNKKVDRFMPIDDIRKALLSAIGDKCNVNQIIDTYLQQELEQKEIDVNDSDISEEDFKIAVEQDAAEAFNKVMGKKLHDFNEESMKYDINDYEELKFYNKGDIISHDLEKSIAQSRKFLDTLLEEEMFKTLMTKDAYQKCKWLVDQNKYILIRDIDWDKIFTDIEENPTSFGRYYSLFRVDLSKNGLVDMCIAFMINDAFYSYSEILAEKIKEE